MKAIKDKYAIVGVGHSDYTLNSGCSEFHLALKAITAAIQDAGLKFNEIDGIVGDHPNRVDPMNIATSLGLAELGFFIETEFGGGGVPSALLHAIAGIESGRAEYIICYKSLNGASSPESNTSPGLGIEPHEVGFTKPFGLFGQVANAALTTQRYMHLYNIESHQFGAVAMACRKHANLNPNAVMFDKPMSFSDYQSSKLIADPLRISDCYIKTDGAAACVITSAERAKDLKQSPVHIMSAGQACCPSLSRGIKDPSLIENETSLLAHELFLTACLTSADIDVIGIYDDFAPFVIMALEDLGFCEKGEGVDFVDGGRIEWPDGKLPLNTSGGNLSEGCIDGFNHIVECVKQLRGTSYAQVKDAEIALICGATGIATSGLILRR